jgi:hypothetical protein
MASVTFPPALGGDGSTVTDDANATTGLGNGGHRARFVPALTQFVAVAETAVDDVTASAASALDSKNSAAADAASASNSRTYIDKAFLGGKTSDPTLDNGGAALIAGTAYFNTTTNKLRTYTGSAWQDTQSTTSLLSSYVLATAGQTVMTVSFGYTIGINSLAVYVNGVRQAVGIGYTETSGSSITFTSPLSLNDEVLFIGYQTYALGTTAATSITFSPTGSIASNNVQAAIAELQTDVNAILTPLNSASQFFQGAV